MVKGHNVPFAPQNYDLPWRFAELTDTLPRSVETPKDSLQKREPIPQDVLDYEESDSVY
jgi:hypothetical protein